jgi:parallel beta-helix repeat protein
MVVKFHGNFTSLRQSMNLYALKFRPLSIWACLGIFVLEGSPGFGQQVIHVPADQPTIQKAIGAATNGDTVLVSPGIYLENVDFLGKSITVSSYNGPASTIIDGNQNGIVVNFANAEPRAALIKGFTIRNSGFPANGGYSDGIRVTAASPTITGNIITQNRGYGIEVVGGGPLIRANTISYTTTEYDPKQDFGCVYLDGSGIALEGVASGATVISGNIIEYNTGRCGGGGIRVDYAGAPLIENNIVRYNEAKGQGGGIYMDEGNQLSIIQNLIYGNTAGAGGGGIYLQSISNSNNNTGPVNLFIVNNTVVGNTISPNPNIFNYYGDGSQISFSGYVSQTGLFNNIVVAGDKFAAVAVDPAYNYLNGTPLVVDHNDILNFSGPRAGGAYTDATGSNGNISADPRFLVVNGEAFHLETGSPAVDSGDNAAPDLPPQDLDGNPRIQNETNLLSPIVDMGVYEGAFNGGSQTPAPDFSVVPSATDFTVQVGQSQTVTLTVTPVGGYIGAISFSCENPPTNVTCTFAPAVSAAGGDNAVLKTNITLFVTSATVSFLPSSVLSSHLNSLLALFAILLCYLLALGASVVRMRRLNLRALASAVLFLSLGFLVSCGGGQTTAVPPAPVPTNSTVSVAIMCTPSGNAVTTHRVILNLTIPH